MLQWFDTLLGLVIILLAISLVIMILNQIIVAILNLRGNDLKSGIKLLLKNSGLEVDEYVKEISNKVLTHPLISDKSGWSGWWKYATTIRKEECIKILEIMSKEKGSENWRNKLRENISDIKETMENWFDNVMDRVSQIFIRHTRISTIFFSIIVAFTLHLDIFSLFHQIYNDAELRASLVATNNAILNQAEEVIGSSSVIPAVYKNSILQLKRQDETRITDALGDPPAFNSREDGENWIREKLAGNEHTDSLVIKYGELINTNLSNSVEKMKDRAYSIKDELEKTKLQLVPEPYPGLLKSSFGENHFWGVLIMAAFLSLGAPFWFKALKTMSTLRPILAEKEDKEKRKVKNNET